MGLIVAMAVVYKTWELVSPAKHHPMPFPPSARFEIQMAIGFRLLFFISTRVIQFRYIPTLICFPGSTFDHHRMPVLDNRYHQQRKLLVAQ